MVPWHPPCALVSLIFSSLDPETNCLLLLKISFGSFFLPVPCVPFRLHVPIPITPYCNWPSILNHFLCSCQGAGSSFELLQVLFPNPESDTDSKRNSSTASDATLCVFVNPRLARLTRSATLLPCFICPVGSSYGRSLRLFSFQLSLTLPSSIPLYRP